MVPPLDTIIGTWELLSYDMMVSSESGETEVRKLAGETPLGRIVFTRDQFISVHVTDPRAISPTEDGAWYQARDEEVLRAARPHVSYCGQFRLFHEGESDYLATTVHVALDPNWVGSEQVRRIEMNHDDGRGLLTLHPTQEFLLSDGKKSTASLTWVKLP
ncbi:unnamed protein product [Clonostachys solani]|uniref:Lipocalin-like domain-containing protein n=1 Tax=Clonostachys solani TaxID=160281 RepID=A0A9P0EP57_9HYPO|nr:unnamed protein product [Clonostachys solani]